MPSAVESLSGLPIAAVAAGQAVRPPLLAYHRCLYLYMRSGEAFLLAYFFIYVVDASLFDVSWRASCLATNRACLGLVVADTCL